MINEERNTKLECRRQRDQLKHETKSEASTLGQHQHAALRWCARHAKLKNQFYLGTCIITHMRYDIAMHVQIRSGSTSMVQFGVGGNER